jgi:hypothetical protein
LVKVPLIRRFLRHFEEVPQKIATFWGTLIKMLLKIATFGALSDVPQKMATFGTLSDVPQKFLCIYYIELTLYKEVYTLLARDSAKEDEVESFFHQL